MGTPEASTHFRFTRRTKRGLLVLAVVGVLLLMLDVLLPTAHTDEADIHPSQEHSASHKLEPPAKSITHHEGSGWPWKRLLANLWLNNLFFLGVAAVGFLFVALQYVSQAGWSAVIKRVPETFGYWLPVSGALMLLLFLVGGHEIFHWTHKGLYAPRLPDGSVNPSYDPIIAGKKMFLNPPFYLGRMIVFFVVWYVLFYAFRRQSLAEDVHGGVAHWKKMRVISIIFVVFFGLSSSVAAWDWILSIDAHWFSTMIGWYVFASWFAAGLAFITYLVVLLKEHGYLPQVQAGHLHDLGKYVFAFSVFWMYIWFSQFVLIYYANIPEEAVYFVERIRSAYAPLFYLNLIVNFFFPFLFLMTRDAKRYAIFLKIACPVVIVGHWLDMYLMVVPGVLQHAGRMAWMEIGVFLIFLSAFLYVLLARLATAPLVAKHHPMLAESLHHHT